MLETNIYKHFKNIRKINLKNVVWKEGKYYLSWNLNTTISSFGNTKKEAFDLYCENIAISRKNQKPHLAKRLLACGPDRI